MALYTDDIKIEGLEELMRAFAELGDQAMPRLKKESEEAGEIVLARTKAKVPVDSGDLRDALYLMKKRLKKGDSITFSRVTFPRSVGYAVPLELGHAIRNRRRGRILGHVTERPFMRPAADESKEDVIEHITKAMNETIEKMGGMK
jgi:HK97 gp10 family phage protein